MQVDQVNQTIQQAIIYKRQWKIKQALAIETVCMKRCIQENDTTVMGVAMLFKALGKLYCLTNELGKAELHFAAGIETFAKAFQEENNRDIKNICEEQMYTCAYHLGRWHNWTHGSKLSSFFRQIQLSFRIQPDPGGADSSIEINKFTHLGMEIYQQMVIQQKGQSISSYLMTEYMAG